MALSDTRPPAHMVLATPLPPAAVLRRAACKPDNAEMWWPVTADPGFDGRRALRICAHCPVVRDCGQWAIANGVTEGIWGGMRPSALKRLVAGPRRATGISGEAAPRHYARRIVCRNGHPLEGGNVRVDRHGKRGCLTCHIGRQERRRAREAVMAS